jgi:hypothetical protein
MATQPSPGIAGGGQWPWFSPDQLLDTIGRPQLTRDVIMSEAKNPDPSVAALPQIDNV